jgi:hypothetical protein
MRPDLRHFTSPRAPHAEDIPQQLRQLPSELSPPYDWAEFSRRTRDRSATRRNYIKWPHAAAAASLTAFIAAMAMLGTMDSRRSEGEATEASVEAASPSGSTSTTTAANDDLMDLPSPGDVQRSREWLARQPAEPALVRIVPRMTVANLEDRIAWFDDALTEESLQGANADNVRVLQQERARLVSSLAQVRYAESLASDGS